MYWAQHLLDAFSLSPSAEPLKSLFIRNDFCLHGNSKSLIFTGAVEHFFLMYFTGQAAAPENPPGKVANSGYKHL